MSKWITRGALDPDTLTTGEATVSRDLATAAGPTAASGEVILSYFTCRKGETITQIGVQTGQAGATGLTLCRYGLYTVDASTGALALVASTPNDTTLLSGVQQFSVKALSAPYAKVVGQRYAVGVLQVGTTPARLQGAFSTRGLAAPRLYGKLVGQADLPASITNAALGNNGFKIYAELLP